MEERPALHESFHQSGSVVDQSGLTDRICVVYLYDRSASHLQANTSLFISPEIGDQVVSIGFRLAFEE